MKTESRVRPGSVTAAMLGCRPTARVLLEIKNQTGSRGVASLSSDPEHRGGGRIQILHSSKSSTLHKYCKVKVLH